ncbi:hypothetical protein [Limnohabitans sp. Jir72]|uniref:hypothetical protein n=1 Tax=Limnohabitans sp. Jir72 TaxID=1977909 RepID=UPI000D38DB72|nr:hypothetical protein [Limnohabitans sp. Jir72]PUE35770.1 hypothetical protein B9Z52_00900 [Limnohabitans sp. Jir72]
MKPISKFAVVVISISISHTASAGWFDTVKRLDCGVEVTRGIVQRVLLELNLTTKKVNIFGPGYGVHPGDGVIRYEVLNIRESTDTLTFGGIGEKNPTYDLDRKSLRLSYNSKFYKEIGSGQCQVIDKFEFKMIPMDKNQI